MTEVRGLIYDCDGVLFESRRANLAYYNAILDHLRQPPVREEEGERVHLCHTAASPQVFEALLGAERVDEALAFAATLDYRQFIPFMTPEPGMGRALEALAARMPLAVATNRGSSMPAILAHFDLARFFRVVVTSRDVARPKPYPDMLLRAAEELGLGVENLLFVGDSELDRRAAGAAGIRFAAYKWPGGEEDLHIGGHADLVEFLRS